MTTSNHRAISTAREERIREENAARTLDGASVGPEADVRDLLMQLDHERAELARVTRGRDLATTRRNDLARELDAVRASAVERITEHSRGVVAGIAGTMGLDASGEGDAVHARIVAEHERLMQALATARAAYDTDLAGLRAEVRRADDERAAWRERVANAEFSLQVEAQRHEALRDAAREYLDAEVFRRTTLDEWLACGGARDEELYAGTVASAERLTAARTRLAALAGGAS